VAVDRGELDGGAERGLMTVDIGQVHREFKQLGSLSVRPGSIGACMTEAKEGRVTGGREARRRPSRRPTHERLSEGYGGSIKEQTQNEGRPTACDSSRWLLDDRVSDDATEGERRKKKKRQVGG
jgi:hypothetical protein